MQDEVADLGGRVGGRRRERLARTDGHGPVELLADERGRLVRVDVAEDAGGDSLDVEIPDQTGDVEPDERELGAERRAALADGPLGDQGQAEEGGVVVDPLEHALDQALEPVDRLGFLLPVQGDVTRGAGCACRSDSARSSSSRLAKYT